MWSSECGLCHITKTKKIPVFVIQIINLQSRKPWHMISSRMAELQSSKFVCADIQHDDHHPAHKLSLINALVYRAISFSLTNNPNIELSYESTVLLDNGS